MDETGKPPRVVGKFGATLMSINGMIGAGIFALPALLYSTVGNFAPWLFLIFGVLFGCGTLVAARFAMMFRSSGAAQLWTQVAFGPLVGFLVGWLLILAMAAGRAATLYVLVSYLAVIFPAMGDPAMRALTLAVLLAALTAITTSGMSKSVGGLAVGTALKLAPIVLLCMFAFARGGIATHFELPQLGEVGSVALLVYFAYSGVGTATNSAGELKNPRRDLPVTMLGSLAAITLFYMLVQWAYIAAGAPQGSGDKTPLAAAAGAVMGNWGSLLLSVAAIFSIATNSLNFFIAAPRVIYGMADRGLLPATLTHVSTRFASPDRAIALFAVLVAAMLGSGAFTFLAEVNSLAGTLISVVCVLAFIVLMHRAENGHDGHMAWYWWVVLAIFSAFCFYIIAQAQLSAYLLLLVLLVLGYGLYYIARRDEVIAPEPEFD
ncbi:APC family permease [Tsuneonella mangrovi]|uniref:APC family permease n=1 Tax=Tsuneonella mangrovi TaxID=1982042 RepID=UPI000BA213A2|nr:APC family permease [Tsuneonella mangrovi]